jgi:porphobilinogen synthase
MQAGGMAFILFGMPLRKDAAGTPAAASDSVGCRAIEHLRRHCPQAYIITDVCLCAYTDHGHCGLIDDDGRVTNDSSLAQLAAMALAHARAGADMIAPSDMMDGRIAAIRSVLDKNGFADVPIMSYSAKYASSFYGPFREAACSAPGKGDRRGYQMDYAVGRDAMIEFAMDLEEGADILMVKPGLPYLDILRQAKERFHCPLAIYHVSGEYSMIKAAAETGWVNEKQVVLERVIAMRRAGADLILTYFAPQLAGWLRSGEI